MAYFISASLFPSPVTPYTGLFVKHRFNALRHLCDDITPFFIVSPTPYFPFKHSCFKHYSLYAQKPVGITHYEGFEIAYPRYAQIPFTHSRFSGYFTYLSIKKYFNYFLSQYGTPKILIAEYGFPDCLAIYELSKRHKIPFVVTLRGSDVSYFMKIPSIKHKMLQALNNAKKIIVVSHNLKQELYDLFQIPLERITVIGNGVDSNVFYHKQTEIRQKYQINTNYLVSSVGGLIQRKNHALAIRAMAHLPDYSLLIVGTGEEYQSLNTLIQSLSLQATVKLIGGKPQSQIADIYSNSDLFLLCSLSEGRPNVVLEALACGTPVLTANVQGVNELITHPDYGRIVDMKNMSPSELAKHIIDFNQYSFEFSKIQEYGHKFSWDKTAELYFDVLHQ